MWLSTKESKPEADTCVLITYEDLQGCRHVYPGIYYPEGFVSDDIPYGEDWERNDIDKCFSYDEDEDIWVFKKEQWLYPNMDTETQGCYLSGKVTAWQPLPLAYEE